MLLIVKPGQEHLKEINVLEALSKNFKTLDSFFHHILEIYQQIEPIPTLTTSLDWHNKTKKLSLDAISSKQQNICIDKKKPR